MDIANLFADRCDSPMKKLLYLLHVICVLFALQTIAAEPAVTTSLIEVGSTLSCDGCALDDHLSQDDSDSLCLQDLIELAEVDVDKHLLPAFSYPIHSVSHPSPGFQLHVYRLVAPYWLERPPQVS